MTDDPRGSAAVEVCGARSVNCTCILPPDHGRTSIHRCEHGSWGRLDPADERAYYALIDNGFDETDAGRAVEIVLKEAARVR